jgi:hypothetical protein
MESQQQQQSSGDGRLRVLWVTDFEYPAKGRDYGAEDRWLIGQLGPRFDITTIAPWDAADAVARFDLVIVRNSGPVLGYAEAYARFRDRVTTCGVPVYNELTGRADMLGKQYLLEMYEQGMPVIPSVLPGDTRDLPVVPEYVVKPLHGADSVGLRVVGRDELSNVDQPDVLIQPRINMQAEISFVFVDHDYQYALSTSHGDERWELHEFEPDPADLDFARSVIAWNRIRRGVQRVDACRTEAGSLLLVELEDLNPYLSLATVADRTRERFVDAFVRALEHTATSRVP